MVRLASGVLLAVFVIAAIRFLPASALRVIATFVALLAAHEYLVVVGTRERIRQLVALSATATACLVVSFDTAAALPVVSAIALAWVAAEVLGTGRVIQQTAADLVAPFYLGVPLGMLVVVHVLAGWQATLLIVALVIVSDSSQYYAGRNFGRRPLAPAISPKKTVEGAAGGVVCGTVFMAVAGRVVFPATSVPTLAALGAALVVLGICGDLFESRLKRTAGLKDSSHLIPGHGGMLDRIDALLFVAPAFYFFVRSLP
jgi:phosphatidate cytidylyltransferase